MSTFKMSFTIVIPKIFDYNNYVFHLKKDLKGNLAIFTSNTCQFKGDSGNIIIDKNRVYECIEMCNLLKEKITNAYLKSINIDEELSDEDRTFFNLIDYVVDKSKIRPKVLFIGYKYNYPETIKNTLEKSNFDCEYLLLDQNIELYSPKVRTTNNDSAPIFKMITDRVDKDNYDNIVVDVPNLGVMTNDYTNTKRLLSYLKSKNKKMIILNAGTKTKFDTIFGTEYDDIVISERYLTQCGHHKSIRTKIRSILI